ncbi:response regulator transcription factor [Massilia arenosa]|uniref:Response regulator transcription factor n=1 Tax=Zemynaea arenosa TaxID=2561931 RepID=A0A4Y9SL29_9BURK|nr:response regulator transcription factor [Massilia arenosa]TFW27370.1 response regulator transcription factor [Massilia arenosa]
MIEDDQRLAGMVSAYLAQHGYDVEVAERAAPGLQRLTSAAPGHYALLLLDLMLPDLDGLEVCRRVRALPGPLSATPIVMLTAKGDPLDRVIGLELGADDYLPKPFEPRELLARLRAVLRRPQIVSQQAVNAGLTFGRLQIDPDARVVRVDGQERPLTAYQFDLLMAMAERAGRVLSREQLVDLVRGQPHDPFDRSIDVHIGRLRAALEDDPKQPRRIVTVRGAGYVFAKVQDA